MTEPLEGIVLINKPKGMTSHDVVDCARRTLGLKRIGHAGTLDPMATGLLVLLVGRATKLFERFVHFDKTYRATLLLGRRTDSADICGKVIEEKKYDHIVREDVEEVFKSFVGDIEQMPPMVSAVKVGGERLYKLARKGLEVKRQPRLITVRTLEILRFDLPCVEFILDCSKGTYVRQIAEDAGNLLGCGACISQIERTKVGPLALNEAVELDQLTQQHVSRWTSLKASRR